MSAPLRGESTLEIRVTAGDQARNEWRRLDMFLSVGGAPFQTTPTEDQKIWNALPAAVREFLLSECAMYAEPDTDDGDAACDDARMP